MTATAAILSDRSVLEIAGEERSGFLQGLVTNDVAGLGAGGACFAGLLSPQGKILFDFFVIHAGDAILLDCPAAAAADLLKRLTFYKLRAKVTLADASDRWHIAAAWGEGAGEALKPAASIAFQDPRLPAAGFRGLIEAGEAVELNADFVDYDAMRIAAAVPEGGKDYAYGDTFPHEACFDLLNGVSFTKGCYVGQEVVSRMQHRGTARTRVLAVKAEAPLPGGGADILAGGFAVGRLGSVAGSRGITLARLDRVSEALAKGHPLSAGGVAVTLSAPAWASYSLDNGGGQKAAH
jgi:folate-binding protein YgfZ